MSFVRIYIHIVWTTHNKQKFLTDDVRQNIFEHIRENAKKKQIYINCINGYVDHVHCLISLGKQQNICDVVQLLKGESSFWINKNKIIPQKFKWEEQFWAEAISYADIGKVRNYILRQEEHHRKKSFEEEYEQFLHEVGEYERVKTQVGLKPTDM